MISFKESIYLFVTSLFVATCLIFSMSCETIKGSKNQTINKVIKNVNENYPQDNIIEESIEQKIEDWTGIDIDLSPTSPEKVTTESSYNPDGSSQYKGDAHPFDYNPGGGGGGFHSTDQYNKGPGPGGGL